MATSTATASQAQQPSSEINALQHVLQMSTGYMISAALYSIVKLSIPDLLANGPQAISALATKTASNQDALYRALRALSSVGIFDEIQPRTFALNPAANYLRADVPGSVRAMVLWMTNKLHFDVWSEMAHSIRTGQPCVEKVYNKQCFEIFVPGEEVAIEFNNAMTNFSQMTIPAVLEAYDFSGIKTLVDVAGGHGHLLAEILKKYPSMNGVLFEMDSVAQEAQGHLEKRGLGGRTQVVGGNFFESISAKGDAYIMQHIIHDWADDKALTILKNVHRTMVQQTMNGKGKLIVLESILQPGTPGDFTCWKDLEMMLLPGGRERSEAEFRELFARGGFRLVRVIPTNSMVSVLEAVPA